MWKPSLPSPALPWPSNFQRPRARRGLAIADTPTLPVFWPFAVTSPDLQRRGDVAAAKRGRAAITSRVHAADRQATAVSQISLLLHAKRSPAGTSQQDKHPGHQPLSSGHHASAYFPPARPSQMASKPVVSPIFWAAAVRLTSRLGRKTSTNRLYQDPAN